MFQLEGLLIQFLLNFFTRVEINSFLRDPQNTATIIGVLDRRHPAPCWVPFCCCAACR
jgi:hypothetical protein